MTSYVDENSLNRLVGKKIKEAREAHGEHGDKITQEMLAKDVGLTRVSIANYETGRQSVNLFVVYKIANRLGVDPKELLPGISEVISLTPDKMLEEQQSVKLTKEEYKAIEKVIKKALR